MAEEPLPAGGSCLLGSINLSEFVSNPFTKNAEIDYGSLENCVFHAIISLNQVLIEGINLHPLQEQRDTVASLRQIGLGTMGLADMLIKLGITYGSEESLKIIEEVYKCIARTAVVTSVKIAKDKGCYPLCNKTLLAESNFIKTLEFSDSVLDEIKKYGLYNSQLLTCAPTGSIGTMFEVSTGVEPIFAMKYTRKTQSLEGKDTFFDVFTKIASDYLILNGGKLPEYFVESKDILPINRIKVQSVLQKYIDASISSTINLPYEATIDDVYNIYLEAWKNGLKGITIYRTGCNREGILTKRKPNNIPITTAPKRPRILPCEIHKIRVKGEHFIVCVGMYDSKPYEVFVFRTLSDLTLTNTSGIIIKKSKGVYSLESKDIKIDNLLDTSITIEEKAATLYSSMLLRHGVSIEYIVKTAKKVNDNITSFSSAMCRILSKYVATRIEGKCPECGEDLIYEGGCTHCSKCSYSKCE